MKRRIFLKRLGYLAGLSLVNSTMLLSAEIPTIVSFPTVTFSLDALDVDDLTIIFDTHIQEAAKRLSDSVDNYIGEKLNRRQ